jgi:hypothetical protein
VVSADQLPNRGLMQTEFHHGAAVLDVKSD